ncbi:hypothetical protein [Thermosulfurimonas sp.]|uniref:hypothetical protein n=1 Tax=Thermosulfurimonas sp. TaxID=2080236 RepID=UPI0025CFCE8D|nr:hypothetical protein [Thermosulfurimonas sp.]
MGIDHRKINRLLQKLRSHPYCVYAIETPHTGYLRSFRVKEGSEVQPGEILFLLERERNLKPVKSRVSGRVQRLRQDLLDRFVEAGEPILEIWHPLSQEEVISEILQEALQVLRAPETARYLPSPEIEARLRKDGPGKALVHPGEDLLIMTFMKRETPIRHEGPPAVIYRIFFDPQEVVPAGNPLLGLCSPEEVPYIDRVLARIREEWPEQ